MPDTHRGHEIETRPARVPDELLSAFRWKFRGEYTQLKTIFWCIHTDGEIWVGVVGDGDNASYEYFTFSESTNKLEVSDMGYGSPHLALRDVLNLIDPPEKSHG